MRFRKEGVGWQWYLYRKSDLTVQCGHSVLVSLRTVVGVLHEMLSVGCDVVLSSQSQGE